VIREAESRRPGEHGPEGRWGGRLTRRDLPLDDPSIDALPPITRRRIARVWEHRAAMERRVAESFLIVGSALERRGAATELRELAARAVDDEYRHTELSLVVASRYAGVTLPSAATLPLEPPAHLGADAVLRDDLWILGHCLFNETTASAYLECARHHAKGALALAATRELLADEIEHGRLGWAYLGGLDAGARRRIGPWLLPLAVTNLRQWRTETPEDAQDLDVALLAAHGAPPAAAIRATLVAALRELILPGLIELGLATNELADWCEAGASTN
jgi:hypothetical protein